MSVSKKERPAAASPWLGPGKPDPKKSSRLNLFCFPYAGGGALAFRGWQQFFPAGVEICPLQLPGREGRLRETPRTDLPTLVGEIGAAILPFLDRPFAFYGHSLGALVAFELARHLRRAHGVEPLHLFASGHRSPSTTDRGPVYSNLPKQEFVEALRRLNGTVKEVLDHPELLDLIIPILRADFALGESYTYEPGPPLACPISALGGLEDTDVRYEHLVDWQRETSAACRVRMFPGDHFFLRSAQPLLLQFISGEVQELLVKLDARR